jgi:hypothetical protein
VREQVPLVGKQTQILLLYAGDDSLCELLLASLEEGGVLVEVALHGLSSADGVIVGQEEECGLEVEFLGTGGGQLALHVAVRHVLQNLGGGVRTLIISA